MARKKSASQKKSKDLDIHSLSERQIQILQAIRTATVLKGYSPSIREIGDAAGLKSTSSVAYQLDILEKKGFLRREPHTPRAFDIRSVDQALDLDNLSSRSAASTARKASHTASHNSKSQGHKGAEPIYVPVLGTIAAGTPIIAEEHIEEYLPLPPAYVRDGDLFALKVEGQSMTRKGILDGDWVVVRQQQEAKSGDIVAASFEGDGDNVDATVKEYFIDHNNRRWLVAHYPEDHDAMEDTGNRSAENARILGKVVSVFRSL